MDLPGQAPSILVSNSGAEHGAQTTVHPTEATELLPVNKDQVYTHLHWLQPALTCMIPTDLEVEWHNTIENLLTRVLSSREQGKLPETSATPATQEAVCPHAQHITATTSIWKSC